MIYIITIITIAILVCLYIGYRAQMNTLYVVGRLYLIKRDNARLTDPVASVGFMRGINHPWYTGRGVQLRVKHKALQIGVCKKGEQHTEEKGVLNAIGGRYLDKPIDELRNW